MWQLINDCGKQLNINFRVRQTVKGTEEYVTEYLIKEVEFDQYVLQLVSKTSNGSPFEADTSEVLVFNCSQLLEYQFEVWTEVSK